MAQFKNDKIIISTPKGSIVERVYTKGQNKGKVYIRIEWNKDFSSKWTNTFNQAQAAFDEEVLRIMEPYVPYDTHVMARSALIASNIGGGELVWATPYAIPQYYNTADSRPYSHLAGGHWGDRCKADNLSHFKKFACKKVGNK